MEITNAEFVISNTDVTKCPGGTFPEYAFIGRSNVGKRSAFCHRFHQSRQAERRQDKQQHPPLSGETARTMGRASPLLRHIFRKPYGTR